MHEPSDIIIFRTNPELKKRFQAICYYHRTTMTRELTTFITEWVQSKSAEKIRTDEEFKEAFELPLGYNNDDY